MLDAIARALKDVLPLINAFYLRVLNLPPQASSHANHDAKENGAAAGIRDLAITAKGDVAANPGKSDIDPALADAHCNLGLLYERLGNARAALRHLRTYRQLARG